MNEEFEVEEVFEEGDTNEVFLTDEGTLIKKFSNVSIPAVTISFAYMLSGTPRFFTRNERMKNERRMRNSSIEGLNFPDIISVKKRYIELEYIEGENLKQKAQKSPEDAYKVGERLGELLLTTREQDLHLVDWSLENFIENDEGLYYVDPEYADFESSNTSDLMDVMSVVLTLKHLPPEHCREALEGFRENFGEQTLSKKVLTNFLTLLNAFTLGSRSEKMNAVRNIKQ